MEHQRPREPAPGDGARSAARAAARSPSRSAERHGRPGDGVHGTGVARSTDGAGPRRPRLRRGAVGSAGGHPAADAGPARSTCSAGMAAEGGQGLLDRLHEPRRLRREPFRRRRALQRCEFVVVQDAFADTETTPFADVLLPAALWAESDQVAVNSERTMTLLPQAVDPSANARPDWALVAGVAQRMGFAADFAFLQRRRGVRGGAEVLQPSDGVRPAGRRPRPAAVRTGAVARRAGRSGTQPGPVPRG